MTILIVSKKLIHEFLSTLDITKSCGPNGLPAAFYRNTSRKFFSVFNKLLENIKRRRKLLDKWKIAALSPFPKKTVDKSLKL